MSTHTSDSADTSTIETPPLATRLVRGSVLFGLLLALVVLDLIDAGVMAALAGLLVAAGFLASERETRAGQLFASCTLSLAGAALATAITLGLIGTYDSFSILTVPLPSLLARAIPFLLVLIGVFVAVIGAIGTRHGAKLASGVAPSTTTLAVVVLVQLLLSTVLLWPLLVRNLAALGYTPGGFLLRALFRLGTVGPAPGAFLFLVAATAVLTGFAFVRLEIRGGISDARRFLLLAAITGGLSAPASAATHLGMLPQIAAVSPALYSLLDLVTTNLLVRVLLLCYLATIALLLTVRRFDTASPGDVISPTVAIFGSLTAPLLLAIVEALFPLVDSLLDRAPPDAVTIVENMLAVSGRIELLVGASTAATIAIGFAVAVLSLLLDGEGFPTETLPAGLAGCGTILAGVGVVVHEAPSETARAAGFLAVAAGLFAWELGAYGRSLTSAVGEREDQRVTLVHSGAIAGVLLLSVLVSYGVTILVRSGLVPQTPQVGLAAVLVLLGALLVVGTLRQSRVRSSRRS